MEHALGSSQGENLGDVALFLWACKGLNLCYRLWVGGTNRLAHLACRESPRHNVELFARCTFHVMTVWIWKN